MSDRADEIAREIADNFGAALNAEGRADLVELIVAVLRSYGDEKLEEAVRLVDAQGWTAPDLHTAIRFLKTSPSTQSDAPLGEVVAALRRVTAGHWIDEEDQP